MKDDVQYYTVVITGNLAGMMAQQAIKNATKVKSIPSINSLQVDVGSTTTYLTPQAGENIQVIKQKGFEKTSQEGEV